MVVSFLASHGGTAARQVIQAINDESLDASVGVIITNNKDSEIYKWCMKNDVEIHHVSGKTHPDEDEKDNEIVRLLASADTGLVVLSGYLKKIGPKTLVMYQNRIMNIHPSLLPAHGGKGMYGDRVHLSVLESGDAKSGATVQLINEEYDAGPILVQSEVFVQADETLESLKAKVVEIEGPLYIEAINKLMTTRSPITR